MCLINSTGSISEIISTGTGMNTIRWTSQDLQALPEDGKRYEIIDGKLYISRQPHWNHQGVCDKLVLFLGSWSRQTGLGYVRSAPGLIFAEDDDAAPDLVWISKKRLGSALDEDGKLHSAPELVIEVLSPGIANEQRDRETKRKLYSHRGVSEYWIISWPKRQIEIYRRNPEALLLELVATLYEGDLLQSPLLPGFNCQVDEIFEDLI